MNQLVIHKNHEILKQEMQTKSNFMDTILVDLRSLSSYQTTYIDNSQVYGTSELFVAIA